MTRPTAVRLYPLFEEHTLPLLVDFAAWLVVSVLWAVLGWGGGFGIGVVVAVLVHAAQMAFLVFVRFDDTAITIVRPWRRRRIEWSRVAGLVYSRHGSPSWYRLHLVFRNNEPPLGQYLTEARIRPYATGPVVMTLIKLADEPASDTRAARCQNRVATELARHGFPLPPPRAWEYRTPAYTPEEATRAAAIDLIGLRPVTVTHGTGAGADPVAGALAELARTHGAQAETVHGDVPVRRPRRGRACGRLPHRRPGAGPRHLGGRARCATWRGVRLGRTAVDRDGNLCHPVTL